MHDYDEIAERIVIKQTQHERFCRLEDIAKKKAKEELLGLESMLITNLRLLDASDAKDICVWLYWLNQSYAGLVRRAYKEVFNIWLKDYPKEFEINCRNCDEVLSVVVNTRQKLKELLNKRKTWNKPVCSECQNTQNKINEENNRISKEYTRKRQEEIKQLKNMPYGDYLKTKHWEDVRRRALARSEYRCQVCNSPGPLDVHHRTYERRGNENYKDVVALCRDCHEIFHSEGKLVKS